MGKTVIYIKSKSEFEVLQRGRIGTIDLLSILKTLKTGFIKDRDKINSNKYSIPHNHLPCKIFIYSESGTGTNITTGSLLAEDISDCLELIMKKYSKELVAEAERLHGVKGHDLEKYIDLMIQQNQSKGNKNN